MSEAAQAENSENCAVLLRDMEEREIHLQVEALPEQDEVLLAAAPPPAVVGDQDDDSGASGRNYT